MTLLSTEGENDIAPGMGGLHSPYACSLFKKLPSGRLEELLGEMAAFYRFHPKGTVVLCQGDRFDSLILVVRGHLEARPHFRENFPRW